MGLFDFVRAGMAVFQGVRKVSKDAEEARQRAKTEPMEAILGTWVETHNRFPENWLCEPRPGADETAIGKACERLGAPLPPEIREFYRLANGIAMKQGDFPYPIVPIAALVPAGAHRPALAAQFEAQWNEWGREEGQGQELNVFTTSLIDLAADRHESTIAFSDAGSLVALTVPREGACIAFVLQDGAYPAGTIMEIENLCATRYAGLKEWLAMSGARIGGLHA